MKNKQPTSQPAQPQTPAPVQTPPPTAPQQQENWIYIYERVSFLAFIAMVLGIAIGFSLFFRLNLDDAAAGNSSTTTEATNATPAEEGDVADDASTSLLRESDINVVFGVGKEKQIQRLCAAGQIRGR